MTIKGFRIPIEQKLKQKMQLHSDSLRQKVVDMIDRTFNKCNSIESLSEIFKPLFP